MDATDAHQQKACTSSLLLHPRVVLHPSTSNLITTEGNKECENTHQKIKIPILSQIPPAFFFLTIPGNIIFSPPLFGWCLCTEDLYEINPDEEGKVKQRGKK